MNSPEKSRMKGEKQIYDEILFANKEINDEFKDDESVQGMLKILNSLFDIFKDSCEKNEKLLQVVQKSNDELVEYAENVRGIITQLASDKLELDQLNQEHERIVKRLEGFVRSEEHSKVYIQNLRYEFDVLNMKNSKEAECEEVEMETKNAIQNLKNEIEEKLPEYNTVSEQLKIAKDQLNETTDEVNAFKEEADRLQQLIDENQNAFETIRQNNMNTIPEMKVTSDCVDQFTEDLEKLETLIENFVIDPNLEKELNTVTQEKNVEINKRNTRLQALDFKKRSLEMLKNNSEENIARRERLLNKIRTKNEQIELLKEDLAKIVKEGNGIRPQFEEEEFKHTEVKKQKNDIRKIQKELIKQIVDLSFKQVKGKNEINMTTRHQMAVKITADNAKKDVINEEHATQELENQSQILSNETNIIRAHQQKMMGTATKILAEIEQRQVEEAQAKSATIGVKELIKATEEKHEEAMNSLAAIRESTAKQEHLVDRLRNERNYLKKLSETATAETAILQRQFDDQIQSIKAMTDRIDALTEMAGRDHEAALKTRESVEIMENMRNQCAEGVKTSEKVNSQLVNEIVTLQNLLLKSEWDYRQQKKEYHMLVNTYHIVVAQALAKEKKIEELKSRVQSDTAVVTRSARDYNKKVTEILKLSDDLKFYKDKEEFLSNRAKRNTELLEEERITSFQLSQEQLKKAAMTTDLQAPRNVHRWTTLEATDPEYAKMLKYRAGLGAKLNAADRELENLQKERDELKKKVDEKCRRSDSIPHLWEVQSDMATYLNDIAEKQRQIDDMEDEIRSARSGGRENAKSVESVRLRLSRKRESIASIKSLTSSVRAEDEAAWFITEPGATVTATLGGGFMPHAPRPPMTARESKRFRSRKMKDDSDIHPQSSRGVRASIYLPEVRKSLRANAKSPPATAIGSRKKVVIQ